MRALRRAAFGFVLFAVAACGRKVPSDVRVVIDKHHAAAEKVAIDAAKLYPAMKASAPFQPSPMAAPPSPPNPAKGTSLDSDASSS